ncbi:phosphoglycerate kinase [Candidatus Woesearchaeota archaeon]|nr:phosphoglycerate kinase [Candidatus Woesearchaeota archaeon]
MKTIKDLKIKNKRVFLRCDFNVPIKNGRITDTTRIENAIPTIKAILSEKPKQIILASHLGRPKGYDEKLSLGIVAKKLSEIMHKEIYLHPLIEAPIEVNIDIVMLENLRFFEGEKKGSIAFAKQLAQHVDVYVDDAFGTAHRKDASVYALAKLLPNAVGLLIQKELENVHLNHPKPIVAIFGAAKIHDKLPLFKKLLDKVDKLILGGGVVFTFLKAGGIEVGKSLVEEEMVETAKQLLKKYSSKIVFPVDFVGTTPAKLKKLDSLSTLEKKQSIRTVSVENISKSIACYDVGPKTVKLFSAVINSSKTVVWNGPLGMFEVKPFDKSTKQLANYISKHNKKCIVCGGDTVASTSGVLKSGKLVHISTGGGASLELLAGNKLPAVEVLK